MRKGVIVRPTDGFGLPGGLRVTISTRRENEKLVKALVGSLSH